MVVAGSHPQNIFWTPTHFMRLYKDWLKQVVFLTRLWTLSNNTSDFCLHNICDAFIDQKIIRFLGIRVKVDKESYYSDWLILVKILIFLLKQSPKGFNTVCGAASLTACVLNSSARWVHKIQKSPHIDSSWTNADLCTFKQILGAILFNILQRGKAWAKKVAFLVVFTSVGAKLKIKILHIGSDRAQITLSSWPAPPFHLSHALSFPTDHPSNVPVVLFHSWYK